MSRKKPSFSVRSVLVPDPNPEEKQRIREELTARRRPRLSRVELRARLDELPRLQRQLSPADYQEHCAALKAEAQYDPKRFWKELGDAFDTYWMRARPHPFHRSLTDRLRYVDKALAALPPRYLKSLRVNLGMAIDRTGVMPWEGTEAHYTPRVVLARMIAEQATQTLDTYRSYLLREKERLTSSLKNLENRAGDYLARSPRHGRPSNLAIRTFLEAVEKILKRYLVPRAKSRDDAIWKDMADVCRYFHLGRLKAPQKHARYVPDPDRGLDTTITRFDKDYYESLDTTFWFPTKEPSAASVAAPRKFVQLRRKPFPPASRGRVKALSCRQQYSAIRGAYGVFTADRSQGGHDGRGRNRGREDFGGGAASESERVDPPRIGAARPFQSETRLDRSAALQRNRHRNVAPAALPRAGGGQAMMRRG